VEPPSCLSLKDLRERFQECKHGRRTQRKRECALTEDQAHQKYIWDLAIRAVKAFRQVHATSEIQLSRAYYQRCLMRKALISFVK
jgi:hypothetical protein